MLRIKAGNFLSDVFFESFLFVSNHDEYGLWMEEVIFIKEQLVIKAEL